MILVSSDNHDQSTNDVLLWLKHYRQDFLRINETSRVSIKEVDISANELTLEAKEEHLRSQVKTTDIKGYWYRRGFFNYEVDNFKGAGINNRITSEVNIFLKTERDALVPFLISSLTNNTKHSIGDFRFNDTNKLENLQAALNSGLSVPITFVTTSRASLVSWADDLKKSGKEIISKPLNIPVWISLENNKAMLSYTSVITQQHIDHAPEFFFPTLFQEKLEKEFEIRVFYLNGECYSTAIFSQNDSMTQVDFRNYNFKKPNRTPPFILPAQLKKGIHDLMTSLGMNCGSLDFVYSKDKVFYFLEVNPVGQFSQVSYPANYKLERLIAKSLYDKKS